MQCMETEESEPRGIIPTSLVCIPHFTLLTFVGPHHTASLPPKIKKLVFFCACFLASTNPWEQI